jgi:hypothetical protein
MAARGGLAAPGAMRGGATAAAPRRLVGAADVRANYHRRLDDLVGRAVDAFRVRHSLRRYFPRSRHPSRAYTESSGCSVLRHAQWIVGHATPCCEHQSSFALTL